MNKYTIYANGYEEFVRLLLREKNDVNETNRIRNNFDEDFDDDFVKEMS